MTDADNATPEPAPRERILATAAALGLTMAAEFVPFSQSRNAKPREDGKVWRSLNWRVTINRGRPDINGPGPGPTTQVVLTTDYSAGDGHTPSGKRRKPFGVSKSDRDLEHMIAWECEHGRPAGGARFNHSGGPDGRGAWEGYAKPGGKPLLPDFADVLSSLVMDSDVLEVGGFEEWARDLGYDTDSRKAEETYRACLEIALKLRAAIGDAGLQALRDAAQDY